MVKLETREANIGEDGWIGLFKGPLRWFVKELGGFGSSYKMLGSKRLSDSAGVNTEENRNMDQQISLIRRETRSYWLGSLEFIKLLVICLSPSESLHTGDKKDFFIFSLVRM